MLAGVLDWLERVRGDIGLRKVGDGVAPGLVEEGHGFAVGDPLATEFDAHPPAKRLGEQHSFR
jgi:hypothetical protein